MVKVSQRNLILIAAFGLFAFVGCQTVPYQPYARMVKKKPGEGGVIAVTVAHQTEDMPKANEMMAANCGEGKFKVTEEGEVVTGTTTEGSASETRDKGEKGHQVGSLFGLPITSGGREASNNTKSSSTTTSIKEWQISYECKSAVASAPAAAPAAGDAAMKPTTAKAKKK